MFKIKVDDGLDNDWNDLISRQISYQLSYLNTNLVKGEVNFTLNNDDNPFNQYYRCKFKLKTRDGISYQVSTKHLRGEIAISEAISRVRREMMRRTRVDNPSLEAAIY